MNIDFSAIPTTTWVSIAAAAAACASAIFSYRSSSIARKSLAIATRTSTLANPNAKLYLIDAFRLRVKNSSFSKYIFCISIDNKSTIANSVVDAEMKLTIVREGIERTVVFRHITNGDGSTKSSINNELKLPTALAPRGGLVANCCFDVPYSILKDADVGPFRLIVKYAEGSVSEAEHNLIMDVVDDEHLEKKRKTGVPV